MDAAVIMAGPIDTRHNVIREWRSIPGTLKGTTDSGNVKEAETGEGNGKGTEAVLAGMMSGAGPFMEADPMKWSAAVATTNLPIMVGETGSGMTEIQTGRRSIAPNCLAANRHPISHGNAREALTGITEIRAIIRPASDPEDSKEIMTDQTIHPPASAREVSIGGIVIQAMATEVGEIVGQKEEDMITGAEEEVRFYSRCSLQNTGFFCCVPVQNFFNCHFNALGNCSTGIAVIASNGSINQNMHIQFKKNIQFTKLVKADGRLREFNFRKLGGLNEGVFTIDVSDDKGNRIMFRMQKEEGKWKIIAQSLPAWILRLEENFHEIIEEESQHS